MSQHPPIQNGFQKVTFEGIRPELEDVDKSRFNEYELSVMAKLSKFEQRTDRLKDAIESLQGEVITRSESDSTEHAAMKAQLVSLKESQDAMATGLAQLLEYKNKIKWTWAVIAFIVSVCIGAIKFIEWIIGHAQVK